MKYSDYLKTEWWRVRRLKLAKDRNFICERCGKKLDNFQVHHKNYKHLWEEKDSDLLLLCADCHQKIHKNTCFDCIYSKIVVYKVKAKEKMCLCCVKFYKKCKKPCEFFKEK